MIAKTPRWRSPKYLKWVKTLPCVLCRAPADDAHHLTGLGGMGGMGTKPPDWATMPLCRSDHTMMHRTPEMWPGQWEHITRAMGKAIDEGVLVMKSDISGLIQTYQKPEN